MTGHPTTTMIKPMARSNGSHPDKTIRHVVWLMAGVMLLSFSFGVAMFLPVEHRSQKLQEMTSKYRERGRQFSTKLSSGQPQADVEEPSENR